MPTTSTAVNAKDAAIFLDDDEGSLVDISGSANKVRFDFTQELGTYRVFQEDWTLRVAHGKDASFKVDVVCLCGLDQEAMSREDVVGEGKPAHDREHLLTTAQYELA